MASFKDKNGRSWTIKLDAPTVRQVQSDCGGLNLFDPEGKAYDQLYDDPLLLCDVLWILVRKEADTAGVSGEQFFEAIGGDPLDAALAAILEAVKDFFPSQRRTVMEAVAAKNAKLREMGIATYLEKLNNPELERRAIEVLEKQMDEALEKALTLSKSATSSPDS